MISAVPLFITDVSAVMTNVGLKKMREQIVIVALAVYGAVILVLYMSGMVVSIFTHSQPAQKLLNSSPSLLHQVKGFNSFTYTVKCFD